MIIKINPNTNTSVLLIIFDILHIFVNIFIINKMPSEMKEFFTAAKGLTPKAVCVGYAYKLFNGSNGILDALNSNTIKYIYQMIIIVF